MLIVDDNENNMLVLESILEDLPINIIKSLNGRDALKIVLKEHIHLFLLDIHMPDMTGYEVAKLIRSRKKTKQTPIIFLSGVIDEGFSDFKDTYHENVECFQKPFDIDDIIMRVNHYLNKS